MKSHKDKRLVGDGVPELESGFFDIKDYFKGGSVLRESDFAALIDYVHYLHCLLGVESEDSEYSPAVGDGLMLNEVGVLTLDFNNSTWMEDLCEMFYPTAIAFSDECVVLFHVYNVLGFYNISTYGFTRGGYMFPVLSGQADDYLYGRDTPMLGDDGQLLEHLSTCSAFRFFYLNLTVEDEFTLKLKDVASNTVFSHVMKIINIEDFDMRRF